MIPPSASAKGGGDCTGRKAESDDAGLLTTGTRGGEIVDIVGGAIRCRIRGQWRHRLDGARRLWTPSARRRGGGGVEENDNHDGASPAEGGTERAGGRMDRGVDREIPAASFAGPTTALLGRSCWSPHNPPTTRRCCSPPRDGTTPTQGDDDGNIDGDDGRRTTGRRRRTSPRVGRDWNCGSARRRNGGAGRTPAGGRPRDAGGSPDRQGRCPRGRAITRADIREVRPVRQGGYREGS